MPFNNFDALLSDLTAVQRLKDSGQLRKALAQADEERIAKNFPSVAELRTQPRVPAVTREPVMLQQLVPNQPKPRTQRAPTRAQLRARFEKTAPQILQKALSLQAAGEISAVDVAKVQAKLHLIEAGIR
jgi:hypothetical protein